MLSHELGRIGEELIAELFPDFQRGSFGRLKPDFVAGDFWIDSKVAYGSLGRFLRDYEKQFRRYMEIFSRGIVVYWRGYSSVAYWAAMQRGIRLISGWELEKILKKHGLEKRFSRILNARYEGFKRAEEIKA